MDIQVLKTYEISEDQWQQIAEGFSKAFDKIIDKESLENAAKSNRLGYSYHAIATTNEKKHIIAYNTILPFFYEQNIKIGVSGSTFVLEKYRQDIFILADMISMLKEVCINEGFDAFVGIPNKNSFKYFTEFLNFNYIGDLPYYILPVRLGNLIKKKNIKPLNWVSYLFAHILILINSLFSVFKNYKEERAKLKIEYNEKFFNLRFPSDIYKKEEGDEFMMYFRVINENGLKIAYLLEFGSNYRRTFKTLILAIRKILSDEKIDAIAFIGSLKLKQGLLFKIPKKMVPQKLPFTYFPLSENNDYLKTYIDNFSHWNFGLTNFDVR